MSNWLTRIFGAVDKTADRVEAAGERIASAAEEMADSWESARDQLRERIGGRSEEAPVALEHRKSSRNGRTAVAN